VQNGEASLGGGDLQLDGELVEAPAAHRSSHQQAAGRRLLERAHAALVAHVASASTSNSELASACGAESGAEPESESLSESDAESDSGAHAPAALSAAVGVTTGLHATLAVSCAALHTATALHQRRRTLPRHH
jgi:hypothetical protein